MADLAQIYNSYATKVKWAGYIVVRAKSTGGAIDGRGELFSSVPIIDGVTLDEKFTGGPNVADGFKEKKKGFLVNDDRVDYFYFVNLPKDPKKKNYLDMSLRLCFPTGHGTITMSIAFFPPQKAKTIAEAKDKVVSSPDSVAEVSLYAANRWQRIKFVPRPTKPPAPPKAPEVIWLEEVE